MARGRRRKPRKQWPPWLIGLILAVVVSVVALLLMDALGYGDDPAVGFIVAGSTTRRKLRPTGVCSPRGVRDVGRSLSKS